MAKLPLDINSIPLPGFEYTGTRANLVAGLTTSSTTIPAGSAGEWVVIRAFSEVYVNFGTSGVTASVAATSMAWTGQELIFKIPSTATHVAAIRVGSTDVNVQLELIVLK